MLKALFFLKIFAILFWPFGQVGKRLDKKAKFNFKIMTSQTEQQIITIHILSTISRSKYNQAMEFGQLIEYNVRNVFFKNHAENETGY